MLEIEGCWNISSNIGYWGILECKLGGWGGIALPSVGAWMQLEMQLQRGGLVGFNVVYDCV